MNHKEKSKCLKCLFYNAGAATSCHNWRSFGKPNNRIHPDVDISDLPNSGVVSRVHAQIRYDGKDYYIQDMGSSNGTHINKYPLIPGVWYKLKPGLSFSFGRRDAVTFIFQLA